jgi:hypothetical protein
MAWKKGQSGNPAGKRPGVQRPTSYDLLVIRMGESRSPSEFLRKVKLNEQARPDLRTQAARDLLPYELPKADRKAACQLNLPAAICAFAHRSICVLADRCCIYQRKQLC